MNKNKIFKSIKKKAMIIVILSILGSAPFLLGATSKFIDEKYIYNTIIEMKYGKGVNQYKGANILEITPEYLFKGALQDIQGVKILLDAIKQNSTIALYRNESKEEYDKVVKNEKERIESEKKTYKDLYGDQWEKKWKEQLEKGKYQNDDEYILDKIRSTITSAAFKEIYKESKVKYKDDNGTPEDKTDDKDREYKALGFNQLFWYGKWFKENRPLHIAELKLDLKAKDDFNDVEMTVDNKKKLDKFIKELVYQNSNDKLNQIDFSGLVSAYSNGNKENGGNLGIINYYDTTISNVATRYNLYNFVADVVNEKLRENSEIVLDNNSTGDTFLNVFKSGERNYFYLNLRNEKFLVSRNEKASISIFRIFGMKDYIDPKTKKQNYLYADYFKNAPKTYKDYTTPPFDIIRIMNEYISSAHPYNAFVLGNNKGIITFVDSKLVKGKKMAERITDYLKTIEKAREKERFFTFRETIINQNKTWKESSDGNSTIDTANLDSSTAWSLWGV